MNARERHVSGSLCILGAIMSGIRIASATEPLDAAASNSPARAYSLEDCLRIGSARSVAVANARRDRIIASAGVTRAKAQAFPHLSATAGYTRLDEVASFDLGGVTTTFGSLDNYTTALQLNQLLYNGGQVRMGLKAAHVYEQFTRLKVTLSQAALCRDVRIAFYQVLLAEAALRVEQESVEHLKGFVKETESKYRQQTVSEFDWLSAQVRLSNELPRLILAQNQLDLAREQLRTLVQLDAGDFTLAGDLAGATPEPPPFEPLLQWGLTHRPEILLQNRMILLRNADARVARSDYRPRLDGFANYQGANTSQLDPTQTGWDWSWNAGLTLRWTLLDGGTRHSAVVEKDQEVAKAQADLEELMRAVTLDIRQNYLDLTHARETVSVAAANIALAEKGLQIAKTRYEQGLSTYLEFTDTNVALSAARLGLCQAQYAYRSAVARLRYAIGLSEDSPTPEITL